MEFDSVCAVNKPHASTKALPLMFLKQEVGAFAIRQTRQIYIET